MPRPTRRCSRCGREDDYSDPDGWIEEEDDSWTCPRCFTPDDRALVDAYEEEAAGEMMDLSCARCERKWLGADDAGDWIDVEDGTLVCPRCLTHVDKVEDARHTIEKLEKLGMDGDGA